MAGENCFNCVYAQWDLAQVVMSFTNAFPTRPTCANHPDSLGRPRPTPLREVCRNFRHRPADPAKGAKQIPLGDGVYAYVDAADYERLSKWTWRLMNGYAGRFEKGKTVLLHRLIMKPPKGMIVDHLNHNKLDNCRINLRVCTRQQNSRNTTKHRDARSRYKGVVYSKQHKKWFARIYFEGRQVHLGLFEDEVEAARAYDRAAIERFGEFANPNFAEDWPPERRKELHEKWLTERATQRTEDRRQRTAGQRRKTKEGKSSRAETRGRRGSEKATIKPPGQTRKAHRIEKG